MIAQGRYKESDALAALFLSWKTPPLVAVTGILIVIGFIVALVQKPTAIGFIVLASLFWLFTYTLWRTLKSFRQNKAAAASVTIAVDEVGLRFKSEYGEGIVPWSHIRKWRSNHKILLIYPTDTSSLSIPSHFFARQDDYSALIETVKNNLGNAT